MQDHQLSFLSAQPALHDLNAIEACIVSNAVLGSNAAHQLQEMPVLDKVLGLGVTTWKGVIDHALRTGHYELFENADTGGIAIRKRGYRYSPIPKLPAPGITYAQQRLLAIAAGRGSYAPDKERFHAVGSDFGFKVIVLSDGCDITAKHDAGVVRAFLPHEHISFSSQKIGDGESLAAFITSFLVGRGVLESASMLRGSKLIASRLLSIAGGVR